MFYGIHDCAVVSMFRLCAVVAFGGCWLVLVCGVGFVDWCGCVVFRRCILVCVFYAILGV